MAMRTSHANILKNKMGILRVKKKECKTCKYAMKLKKGFNHGSLWIICRTPKTYYYCIHEKDITRKYMQDYYKKNGKKNKTYKKD